MKTLAIAILCLTALVGCSSRAALIHELQCEEDMLRRYEYKEREAAATVKMFKDTEDVNFRKKTVEEYDFWTRQREEQQATCQSIALRLRHRVK